jgi:hypothetical protein
MRKHASRAREVSIRKRALFSVDSAEISNPAISANESRRKTRSQLEFSSKRHSCHTLKVIAGARIDLQLHLPQASFGCGGNRWDPKSENTSG